VHDSVIEQIDQTTNPFALRALAQALEALPVKPTEAQASQALERLLKQIGQTTDPAALQELARVVGKRGGCAVS
jgi:hypothetical protein